MKTILREETTGVSEVLGTILILAMTVTLFSTVIVWVSNIPTPQAQTRSDIASLMQPIYGPGGLVVGVNITLTHMGGEALQPASTVFYITDQPSSGPSSTDVATLHRFNAYLPVPSGLVDGSDSVWTTGERWIYLNQDFSPSDTITVTIVDNTRSLVVWSGQMNPAAGTRPPIFLKVWATGVVTGGGPNPVYAGSGFYLFADVVAPDHNLNPNSVYATITAWYGVSPNLGCEYPQKLHDDGEFPDQVAGDGIFSLGAIGCMYPPYPLLSWSGSLVLLNATDLKGHQTQTRFVLNVLPPVSGAGGAGTTIPNQVWQYIGFVQIRTGEAWVSNLSNPYTSPNTYQPYRVQATTLNGNGGALFHFKMANHGNTTIFIDGWTEAFFQNTQSSSGFALYIVAPCNPLLNANAGGVAAYPGSAGNINNFSYAHPGLPASCSSAVQPAVFDINRTDQQTGGTPYTVLVYNLNAFGTGKVKQWQSASYFISILVSGMAGPNNYTYAQLIGKDTYNPYGCSGLGLNYNPINHLNDPIPACRSTWYAQVIPFIGMVVY